MAIAAANEDIEQLRRDILVMRDQFVELADMVILRLIEPAVSTASSSKKSGGLSDSQKAKLLRKRRANVAASLTRQHKQNNKQKTS